MASAMDTLATFWSGSEDALQYRLAASLDGHKAPVNTLAFNAGSTLLASGGS